MDSSRIVFLYQRFNNQSASAEEVLELHTLLTDPDSELTMKMLIDEEWKGMDEVRSFDLSPDRVEAIFDQIVSSSQFKPRFWTTWKGIAAAALFFLTLGVCFYTYQHVHQDEWALSLLADHPDILPGKNKAMLILGNGEKIILSDAKEGVIIDAAQLKYNDGAEVVAAASEPKTETALLSINTPIGGTYQVLLADGTKVWLNAASVLKFPKCFSGDKRSVELSGEAYFEVKKDKNHPFIVVSNRQEVTVLGTHFNVNAYGDEGSTKTTLLEGSVRVSSLTGASLRGGTTKQPHTNDDIILIPNQQAVLAAGVFTATDVDGLESIAWKNGKFTFDREDIQSIMRKVARWYNVQVVYEGNLNGIRLTGSVSRFENISKLLQVLENTQEVRFKIEGRRIIVKPS